MEVFHYPIGAKIPGTSYRVVDRLAAGGMGAVYEVIDENLDKRLIVKTIIASLARRDDLVTRMRREAKALAKLSHPNIVQIFRFDETEDSLRTPYLVMELLEGESLRSCLERDGALAADKAKRIVLEILSALAHSHSHGIVHRDVKPENIFLHRGHDGTLQTKLIDFGIVSVPNPDTQRLTSDRFIGTLGYAAPEQILGEAATPLVDIFAVGVVFYELVTGANPFEDLDVVGSLARAQVERTTKFPEAPGLSKELGELILRSFRNDPKVRPASANEFAAAIRGELSPPSGRMSNTDGMVASAKPTSLRSPKRGVLSLLESPLRLLAFMILTGVALGTVSTIVVRKLARHEEAQPDGTKAALSIVSATPVVETRPTASATPLAAAPTIAAASASAIPAAPAIAPAISPAGTASTSSPAILASPSTAPRTTHTARAAAKEPSPAKPKLPSAGL